jgi:hypothetical protein
VAINPIIVVSLSVAPEQHAAFTEFYHHQFLPAMLKETPEIVSIKRYEELGGGGSVRLYNKQTLTIYELKQDYDVTKADELFARESLKEVVETFGNWKSKSLRNFARISYQQSWASERNASRGIFHDGGLFLFALDMKPPLDQAFQTWYETEYLPLQIADTPGWTGVRRFTSVGREQPRTLTFFEAVDEDGVTRCLKDLRAAHRINQNYEWQKRIEEGSTWHESISLREIYRRPW